MPSFVSYKNIGISYFYCTYSTIHRKEIEKIYICFSKKYWKENVFGYCKVALEKDDKTLFICIKNYGQRKSCTLIYFAIFLWGTYYIIIN